jgi:hypothetical protein
MDLYHPKHLIMECDQHAADQLDADYKSLGDEASRLAGILDCNIGQTYIECKTSISCVHTSAACYDDTSQFSSVFNSRFLPCDKSLVFER